MTTLATYSLQIVVRSDPGEPGLAPRFAESDKRVLSNLPALIEAAEEDLSDLLPDGYEVKITEAMT